MEPGPKETPFRRSETHCGRLTSLEGETIAVDQPQGINAFRPQSLNCLGYIVA